jgi:hypothetical protein
MLTDDLKIVVAEKLKIGTKALSSFVLNFDKLRTLVQSLLDSAERRMHYLKTLKDAIGSDEETPERTKGRDEPLDILVEEIENAEIVKGFVFQWLPVILVSFVEAYLEDVFTSCAQVDPTLMEKSELTSSYRDIVDAKS